MLNLSAMHLSYTQTMKCFNIRAVLLKVGTIGAILMCIISLFIVGIYEEKTNLEEAIHASQYTVLSLNMPIVICVPLFIDMILDGYFNSIHGIFLKERLLMLGGYLLPSLFHIIMSYQGRSLRAISAVVGCLYAGQIPFNIGVMCSMMATSVTKRKVFSPLIWTIVFICIGQILGMAYSASNASTIQILVLYWISICVCFANYTVFVVRYIFAYRALEVAPIEEMLPLSLCIVLFIYGSGLFLCPIVLQQYTYLDFTPQTLLGINILNSFTYICGILLPGRCSRNLMHETQRTIDSKRAFVRYISHEIRTPANICGVGLGLVVEQLKDLRVFGGELKEIVNQVQDSMFSISETLNNLLEFENVDSGSLEISVVEVRPLDFVRSTIRLLELQAKQNGIRFISPASDETRYGSLADSTIEVDVFKMGQALRNFVSNAIKFTPIDGSISVTVEPFCAQCRHDAAEHICTPHHADPWIRIGVTDSGEGMSTKMLQKLQDEGIQFEHSNLEPGQASGLSLFISKSIVHKHGGRVVVQSRGAGCGSTFAIEIPLYSVGNLFFHEEVTSQCVVTSADQYDGIHNVVVGDLSQKVPESKASFSKFSMRFSKVEPVMNYPERFEVANSIAEEMYLGDMKSKSNSMLSDSDVAPSHGGPTNLSTRVQQALVPVKLLDRKRILCVDDSAVNLKMVVMLFSRLGAICDQAVNGVEAVAMVSCNIQKLEGYDFIVMDNFMPEMGGPEACIQMREIGYVNPIFGLTGHVLDVDMKEYYRAGANHVFKKPLNLKEFKEIALQHRLISDSHQSSAKSLNGASSKNGGGGSSSSSKSSNSGCGSSFEKSKSNLQSSFSKPAGINLGQLFFPNTGLATPAIYPELYNNLTEKTNERYGSSSFDTVDNNISHRSTENLGVGSLKSLQSLSQDAYLFELPNNLNTHNVDITSKDAVDILRNVGDFFDTGNVASSYELFTSSKIKELP